MATLIVNSTKSNSSSQFANLIHRSYEFRPFLPAFRSEVKINPSGPGTPYSGLPTCFFCPWAGLGRPMSPRADEIWAIGAPLVNGGWRWSPGSCGQGSRAAVLPGGAYNRLRACRRGGGPHVWTHSLGVGTIGTSVIKVTMGTEWFNYTKYDVQCHMVFDVTVVIFRMTLLMNNASFPPDFTK